MFRLTMKQRRQTRVPKDAALASLALVWFFSIDKGTWVRKIMMKPHVSLAGRHSLMT